MTTGPFAANALRKAAHIFHPEGSPDAEVYARLICLRILEGKFIVKLRASYLSGGFDTYWNFHVTQDQQSLYPQGRWAVSPYPL